MRVLFTAQRRARLRCAVVFLDGILAGGAILRAVAFSGAVLAASAAFAQSSIDPARGKTKATPCEACHGTQDRPAVPGTPWLAGQLEDFIATQMFLFREGLREAPQMTGVLNGFSDYDLVDVAAYFGRQKPVGRGGSKPDPKLHARGAELSKSMGCGTCHMQDFRGQKQIPRISNQREDYLATTMKAYRDNKRTGADTSMNGILYKVPDGDIEAMAHFLAHQ
jgi:cytochrome c553